MLTSYLQMLMAKPHLTEDEAEKATEIILSGADPHQTAAFLAILKYRGETADEIAGMLSAIYKKALTVKVPHPVMDIVGTGGDLAKTVNISTGSAILAAACGIPIAKHGNRSVSSQCGSADVLEALEIDIETQPEQVMQYLNEAGIAFMYAPLYHSALKTLSPIRKGLKLPTVLNILGPLLNPAQAEYALIGVANEAALEQASLVVQKLGKTKRTLIFHGCGLDELTTLGTILAYDIHDGKRERLEIDPGKLGFPPCSIKDLQGGNAQCNAKILKETFSGKIGAVADALVLNAGAAAWIFGKADSIKDGIHLARSVLQKGGALEVLDKWTHLSKQVKIKRKHETV